jgi:glutamate/tyrosine decarboxylase-like PLP-dependent enzyme
MREDQVKAALEERTQLLADAARRAQDYLAAIGERHVAPSQAAVARLDALDFALPEKGISPREILARLDDVGSPATVASAGPRFFGFVVGGALPIAVASSWLVDAWDQNAGLRALSPVAARLDDVALRWLSEIFRLPAGAGGGFVTGATMANAACLAAARDATLQKIGWDAAALGLVGAPAITVAVGAEAHTTVHKALGLVGLGRERVVRLPVDDQGRVVPESLPELEPPAIVCLQAGNVNSGSFDPFPPLIGWAHRQGAWVHIDGAFGLWALASAEFDRYTDGITDADSWACDAHKWLNTTYDCGIALVREKGDLFDAMRAHAAYYVESSEREPAHYTPQSSQRARGVEVWSVLATLGRDGIAELVSRTSAMATRFADAMRSAGFEVRNEVVLNQVVVSFGSDAMTDAVITAVQDEGTCWCGPTIWQGRRAMRFSVSGWATTSDDIDRSAAAVVRVARSLSS